MTPVPQELTVAGDEADMESQLITRVSVSDSPVQFAPFPFTVKRTIADPDELGGL